MNDRKISGMRLPVIFLTLTIMILSGSSAVPGVKGEAWAAEDAASLFQKYKGEQQELKLPEKVSDVVLAGGGRYLLIQMGAAKQLAVFDVNQAKIVKTLPLLSDKVKIAAGAEKFIVIEPDQHIIERWSLTTFEREKVSQTPFSGILKAVGMGYASQGPFVVRFAEEEDYDAKTGCLLIDLETLAPVPDLTFRQRMGFPRNRETMRIRASAGGELFGISTVRRDRESHLWVLDGKKVNNYRSYNLEFIRPLPDASYVLTRYGLFTRELFYRGNERGKEAQYVATLHPAFYLEVPYFSRDKTGTSSGSDYFGILYLTETGQRIANLPLSPLNLEQDESKYGEPEFAPEFSLDKRLVYIPQADLLLTFPYTNDRMLMTPIQLQAELKKRGTDYLFISSLPPSHCQKGKTLEYSLQVESSSSQFEVELSAAPEGMKLIDSKKLRWEVPESFDDDEVFVVITVKAKGDQTEFQTFRLEVQDR